MDTHSYDGLMSFTLYTKHLLLSPFLYCDSTRMLSSSDIISILPHLNLYACTYFPLTIRLLAEPRPGSEIFVVSKDNSSVVIDN
jgi:hypothetical protein